MTLCLIYFITVHHNDNVSIHRTTTISLCPVSVKTVSADVKFSPIKVRRQG